MSRKPGPNLENIKRIRKVLKMNPNGLWVREIARQAKMDKSTVSIYLNKYMQNEIVTIFSVKGGLIKIVRLKK
jgi:DNA invertase Pin-like site-specific DNA recombinase